MNDLPPTLTAFHPQPSVRPALCSPVTGAWDDRQAFLVD